jgi:hypothetical protein
MSSRRAHVRGEPDRSGALATDPVTLKNGMSQITQDIRYAIRAAWHNKTFSVVAILNHFCDHFLLTVDKQPAYFVEHLQERPPCSRASPISFGAGWIG